MQVRGKGGDVFLPGWSYSLLVGLRWGSSSWVDPVEARRVLPGEDHTELTLAQVRDLLADLGATGKLVAGDPPPLVVFDAGYDPTALAHELACEQVQVLVRLNLRFKAPLRPDDLRWLGLSCGRVPALLSGGSSTPSDGRAQAG